MISFKGEVGSDFVVAELLTGPQNSKTFFFCGCVLLLSKDESPTSKFYYGALFNRKESPQQKHQWSRYSSHLVVDNQERMVKHGPVAMQ